MNFDKQIIERLKISPAKGTWNPSNSEPRTGNPEQSTAWNPESKTVSDYLTSDERLASTAYYQTYCF